MRLDHTALAPEVSTITLAGRAVVPGAMALPQLLEEADALPLPVAPPMTQRGAHPSSHGVDYLGITVPDTTGRLHGDVLGAREEEWLERGRGMRHYPAVRAMGEVRVGYGGDPRMGSHLEAKGKGCRELESTGKVTSWQKLAQDYVEVGAKCSRIDFYIDCHDGSITPEECYRKFKADHIRCHSTHGHLGIDCEAGEEADTGSCFTIGERVSDTYVRIYDKAQRECPKELKGEEREKWLAECGPWVRVEVELKNERANAAFRLLAEKGFGWGLIQSLINSYIRFTEGYAKGHNGHRVPTWGPWERLMGSPERVTLARGVMAVSLAQSERNLEKMWGPTVLTLIASKDGDIEWLRRLALRSKGRIREKHRKMLLDAERLAETWGVA